MFVFNDEDHVESRQNSRHKVDIVVCLSVIPPAEDRICGSEHRATGVESCCYASLEKVRVQYTGFIKNA